MTKTQKQNARRNAKAIAKDRRLTYQQGLDIVAQEAGYPHWSAMKAAMETPEASPLNLLDPAIKYAWDRRGESMNLVFDETGTSLIVNTGDRITFGIGLNPEGTAELKKQFNEQYGIDIDGEISQSQGVIYTIALSDRKYDLPIRIITRDEKREMEIQLPKFEERVAVPNPLTPEAMDKVGTLLWHCDHGLTVICSGSKAKRQSSAEHLTEENISVANIGIYEEDDIDAAIAHSHGWHAILLIEKPDMYQHLRDLGGRDNKIRYIAGIELGHKSADVVTFEDPYPAHQGNDFEGFSFDIN